MALLLMNWDFNLIAELPDFESLQLTRSFWGLGGFEMRIHPKAAGACELAMGRVLFLSDQPHKAMLIDKINRKDDKVTVSGKPIKGIAGYRICVPPAIDDGHFGWDRMIGSAESAYHHYAAANLYAPQDAKRKIERLEAAVNLNRGIVLPWQSRFGNLEAIMGDIGETTELGWDIVPDFHIKRYLFTVMEGRDLTIGTGKVVITEQSQNAGGVSFTMDQTALRTTAYVGGSGEDENRLILSEGNEHTGYSRRETWVDAGSIFETEMLRMSARKKLETAKEKETFSAEVMDSGLCRYERDFDLGDKIVLTGENLRAETRLTEMRESYESGTRKLQATFGMAPVKWVRELRDTVWPTIR